MNPRKGSPQRSPALKRRAVLASLATCGSAWSAAVTPAMDRPAVQVRHPSRAALFGTALAGARWVAVGERGLVAMSDDRGHSWRQAQVPVSVTLTAVAFSDAERGYAAGHGGTVLGTRDGGLTWTRLLDGRALAALLLEAAMRSADAAQIKSAERMVQDGPDKPLLDLVVSGPSEVFAVGAYGIAVGTTDGGKTWTSHTAALPNPKGLHLYAVRRRGQTLVIAGEQGLLLRSDDGGRSLRNLPVPYQGSFFTVELPSGREMVAAGMRGNVWYSADAGLNWHRLPLPSPAAVTASSLQADGSFVLTSQAGQLLSGTSTSVRVMKAPPLPPLTGVLPVPGGSLLAVSFEGVHLLPTDSAVRSTR